MTTAVDGILVQWGDRLFYDSKHAVRSRTPALAGLALRGRAQVLRQRIRATVVRAAPQVMVKVTGGGRGMAAIAAHLRYISKAGRLPIEDDRGVTREGAEALSDRVEQWRTCVSRIPEQSHRRQAFNLMLSMPARTPAAAVQAAARAFASTELPNHRYAMVLHTHQMNPHVHLSVRAEGRDGQRLNPRKADLRRWRETFAEKLCEIGIEAEASPQTTRGISRRNERLWHRKTRDDDRPFGPKEGEQAAVKLTRSRRVAAQAWCEIAKALASSEDMEDCRLGQSIVDYVRWLPGVRYTPPQRQAQRELPGLERGASREREQILSGPTREPPQRTMPDFER